MKQRALYQFSGDALHKSQYSIGKHLFLLIFLKISLYLILMGCTMFAHNITGNSISELYSISNISWIIFRTIFSVISFLLQAPIWYNIVFHCLQSGKLVVKNVTLKKFLILYLFLNLISTFILIPIPFVLYAGLELLNIGASQTEGAIYFLGAIQAIPICIFIVFIFLWALPALLLAQIMIFCQNETSILNTITKSFKVMSGKRRSFWITIIQSFIIAIIPVFLARSVMNIIIFLGVSIKEWEYVAKE
ncbi:MAG: hypothetical protein IJZ64_00420 [Ruminococcus sp.]|nr:hypothetical protein [Ruminococcus sp.]